MGGILAISEVGEDHKRPVLSAEIKAKCIIFHGYLGPQEAREPLLYHGHKKRFYGNQITFYAERGTCIFVQSYLFQDFKKLQVLSLNT